MSSPSIGSAFLRTGRRRLRSATPDRTLAPVRLGVDLKNGCGLVGIVQWKRTQRFQRLLALGYQALQVGLLLLGEPLAVLAEDGLDFGFHFGTTLGRQRRPSRLHVGQTRGAKYHGKTWTISFFLSWDCPPPLRFRGTQRSRQFAFSKRSSGESLLEAQE